MKVRLGLLLLLAFTAVLGPPAGSVEASSSDLNVVTDGGLRAAPAGIATSKDLDDYVSKILGTPDYETVTLMVDDSGKSQQLWRSSEDIFPVDETGRRLPDRESNTDQGAAATAPALCSLNVANPYLTMYGTHPVATIGSTLAVCTGSNVLRVGSRSRLYRVRSDGFWVFKDEDFRSTAPPDTVATTSRACSSAGPSRWAQRGQGSVRFTNGALQITPWYATSPRLLGCYG